MAANEILDVAKERATLQRWVNKLVKYILLESRLSDKVGSGMDWTRNYMHNRLEGIIRQMKAAFFAANPGAGR
jgi:hypothetical protein